MMSVSTPMDFTDFLYLTGAMILWNTETIEIKQVISILANVPNSHYFQRLENNKIKRAKDQSHIYG